MALILIPARIGSTRLPGKPLADICGKPMIRRVWDLALEAGVGPVVVAAGEPEIVEVIERAGGRAILTDPELPSGSDRIYRAMQVFDPGGLHRTVVNLQGDLPALDPKALRTVVQTLEQGTADVATLAAVIKDKDEITDPNAVKVIAGFSAGTPTARALAFTRAAAPWGPGDLYHHIGIYAYRRRALNAFVALPPSVLEKREGLEQMRLLENGMTIDVTLTGSVPNGVDTPQDLEQARAHFS